MSMWFTEDWVLVGPYANSSVTIIEIDRATFRKFKHKWNLLIDLPDLLIAEDLEAGPARRWFVEAL